MPRPLTLSQKPGVLCSLYPPGTSDFHVPFEMARRFFNSGFVCAVTNGPSACPNLSRVHSNLASPEARHHQGPFYCYLSICSECLTSLCTIKLLVDSVFFSILFSSCNTNYWALCSIMRKTSIYGFGVYLPLEITWLENGYQVLMQKWALMLKN